jgi:hypothetical protein
VGGCSSSRSSGTTSTSDAPTRSAWSSTGASTAAAASTPRAGSALACLPRGSPRACTSTTNHTTIKQHHKEGRALSTQTTINDPGDVGIRTRLTHLPALREIGLSAHRRQLGVQRLSHNPIRAAEAFTAVHQPTLTRDGHRIAGLRLGDHRAQALLQVLLVFRLLPRGFRNRDLRGLLAELLGLAPTGPSAGQVSYDLRRLRAHGRIARAPGSHRYRVTDTGLAHAKLITDIHTRLPEPGPAQLTDPDPPAPSALRAAARNYQHALDHFTQQARFAA